jgi:peptide chain release factor 1
MRPGYACIKVSGEDAARVFENEAGGHRWQRVPSTEKRGRVQTSTITVAVLEELPGVEVDIPAGDIEVTTARGSGKGGQHRNVTDSAVQVKHIPTGIIVRCESERSQHQNKEQAMSVLRQRIHRMASSKATSDLNDRRRGQVGSGMRGDKVRTIRVRDGIVVNHINGRRTSYKRYSQGLIEDLS